MIHFMGSQELQVVRELLRSADLASLTIAERRLATASFAVPPGAGTAVDPVDAGGVPAEWVAAPGVCPGYVLLYFHGGAYQIGSPATIRHLVALLSGAAGARALSVDYGSRQSTRSRPPSRTQWRRTAGCWPAASIRR